MCTGKRFEIHLALILGFDTEAEAVATSDALRAATTAVALEGQHPGGVRCQLFEKTSLDPAPPSRAAN